MGLWAACADLTDFLSSGSYTGADRKLLILSGTGGTGGAAEATFLTTS